MLKAKWAAANAERIRAYHAKYRANNPEKVRAARTRWRANHPKEYRARYMKRNAELRRSPQFRIKELVRSAKLRALKRGLAFDAKLFTALAATTCCGCCGRTLDYSVGNGGKVDASPSLDRMDNDEGYTMTNTAVVCWRCNKLKGNSAIAEIEALLRYVKRLNQLDDDQNEDILAHVPSTGLVARYYMRDLGHCGRW